MTLDQLAAQNAESVRDAVRSLQLLIRSGAPTDDIRSILRNEIEDASAVSDMQVFAAFVRDTWE